MPASEDRRVADLAEEHGWTHEDSPAGNLTYSRDGVVLSVWFFIDGALERWFYNGRQIHTDAYNRLIKALVKRAS